MNSGIGIVVSIDAVPPILNLPIVLNSDGMLILQYTSGCFGVVL